MEKSLAIPQKVKHRITISSSDPTPRYKTKRTENKFLYINVHSSTIHNSQKVETIQTSIIGWTDKLNMVYSYNGISFSQKEKYWHMLHLDAPQKH